MGLDTTHGCWHGAYSAFSRWRNTVAEAAGYTLMDPLPHEGPVGKYPMIEWTGVEERNFKGEWDRTPPDPLLVLIVHSDCDGVIHPEQAGPLARRLAEIFPNMPEGDGGGHIGNWRATTQAFIDGLLEAARLGEDVKFQ